MCPRSTSCVRGPRRVSEVRLDIAALFLVVLSLLLGETVATILTNWQL